MRDRNIETPPGRATLHGRLNRSISGRRQPGIRVQEKQHLATAGAGTGIHLQSAAARGDEQLIDLRRVNYAKAAIGAAAIHHHQLGAGRAQGLERGDLCRKAGHLVQYRQDDRQTW